MRRYSLYTIVFAIFAFLIIVSIIFVYFATTQHRKDLIETAVKEKTHLAETINETLASPVWIYRLALVPGMERAFIEEVAGFKDVKYIRVVSPDGTIYKSSIEGEWGEIIKDPDIYKVASSRKEIVKDQIFEEEEIKVIIYPGYQDRTIWVAFSLGGVKEAVQKIWVRDMAMILGSLLFFILVLFALLRSIINPLKEMREVCEDVGEGDLDVKMEVESKTEIGELADTFNHTIKELKRSKEALEEAKGTLEVKVAARTKELKELTDNLEEEVKRRTREVYDRMEELEKIQRLTVGRELKMIELKKEIKRLGEEPKNIKKKKVKEDKSSFPPSLP